MFTNREGTLSGTGDRLKAELQTGAERRLFSKGALSWIGDRLKAELRTGAAGGFGVDDDSKMPGRPITPKLESTRAAIDR
jgi:hypothetical protein